MQPIPLRVINWRGDRFSDFYPEKNRLGSGWAVFGRNSERYGVDAQGRGCYVMECARPDKPRRKMPNWNGEVYVGFRTKREAQEVADRLNLKLA